MIMSNLELAEKLKTMYNYNYSLSDDAFYLFRKNNNVENVRLRFFEYLPDNMLKDEDVVNKLIGLIIENTDHESSLLDQYQNLSPKLRKNRLIVRNIIDFNGHERYSENADTYFLGLAYDKIEKSFLTDRDFILDVWKLDPKALLNHNRKKFDENLLTEIENDRAYLDELLNAYKKDDNHAGASLVLLKTRIENIHVEDLINVLKEENYSVLNRPEIIEKFKDEKNAEFVSAMKKSHTLIYFGGNYYGEFLDKEYQIKNKEELMTILEKYNIEY